MYKISFVFLSLFISLTSISQTKTDVVYLKNGSKLRGTIVYNSDSVTNIIVVGGSIWSVPTEYITGFYKQNTVKKNPDTVFITKETRSSLQIHKTRGYNLMTNIGLFYPLSGTKSSYFHCSAINSYSFWPNLSVGIGLGIDRDVKSYFPVYGDIRYYLNMKSFAPFVSVSYGKSFAWDKKETFYWRELNNTGGPFFATSVGTEFPLKEKLSLLVSLEYKYQKSTFKSKPEDEYYELVEEINRIGIKLGLLFH